MTQERKGDIRSSIKKILGYGLGIGVICAAIGLAYLGYQGRFSSDTISSWLTATLIIITAVYALLTQQSVGETRRARKQEVMPILKIESEPWAIGQYGLRLKNIGDGPARNISVGLQLDDSSNTRSVSRGIIATGEWVRISQPFGDEGLSSETVEQFENLSVNGTFEDSYEDEISINDTYRLRNLIGASNTDMIMDSDSKASSLNDIATELSDLNRKLDSNTPRSIDQETKKIVEEALEDDND